MNEINNNVLKWTHVRLARLVLETRTPLSIGQGQGNAVFDNVLVSDANGLAAIPGTSFIGVLRHLYRKEHGAEEADRLFGNAAKDREWPSRVRASWGCIHDSNDQPVEGLVMDDRLSDELLLDAAREIPLKRDRVRINNRGVAEDKGQFDRVALRAGHRFSLELSLWDDVREDITWKKLLNLLGRHDFRLGGSTRGGLGAVKPVRIHERSFHLNHSEDFRAYGMMGRDLDNVEGFGEKKQLALHRVVRAHLELEPEDFYRFGQGREPLKSGGDKDPDLLPATERIVVWENGRGRISSRKLVAPATAVKGALRHRVAFHYNALNGVFAEQCADPIGLATEDNEAVRALFGHAADNHDGQPGVLVLDDLFFDPATSVHLTHNGIDRFTGGVRHHVLYGEEVVGGHGMNLDLIVLDNPASGKVRKALNMALQDLAEGRLALGAGAARGHGFFGGTVTWSDGGAWIEGGAS